MIISTELILRYIGKKKLHLLFLSISGGLTGFIYSSYTPKIYEVITFLNLPYINLVNETTFNDKKTIIIPSPKELRQYLMNPLNITNEMLEICNLQETNKDKLKLISLIYIDSFDKNDKSILLRIRSEGLSNTKKCSEGLIKIISGLSDNLKNSYVYSINLNNNILLADRNSEIVNKVMVSDSYIYPRTRLNILFGMLVGLMLTVFLSLTKNLKKSC
jgi:hypothetical protein